MAPRKARDVEKALLCKGFEKRESHHTFLHLFVDGKKTRVWTKISHGSKDISDPLLGQMSRDLAISRRDFEDLVDCPLSREEYLAKLRQHRKIS